jgi:hypothetical protein
MSNYTKSTNFASKDSLSAGDPLKIVKGTEINTEFDNIATAVATKADLASPALTGTPTAPTASAGTSSTQIATTAFLATMYPVGSIYSSTVSTNPNSLFGFGTWTAFAAGRVMVGNGGGFSAGSTGGSADATLVSHTHTATTDTAGSHTHRVISGAAGSNNGGFGESGRNGILGYSRADTYYTTGDSGVQLLESNGSHTHSFTTDSSGSSGTNANLQPYIVVYMWNRTA